MGRGGVVLVEITAAMRMVSMHSIKHNTLVKRNLGSLRRYNANLFTLGHGKRSARRLSSLRLPLLAALVAATSRVRCRGIVTTRDERRGDTRLSTALRLVVVAGGAVALLAAILLKVSRLTLWPSATSATAGTTAASSAAVSTASARSLLSLLTCKLQI